VSLPFGRFLELSLGTHDIAASVLFYERLGFAQFMTGDAWPHRYGVVGDGRIHLGLHECTLPSPAVSFVLPQLARAQAQLQARQIRAELALLGDDALHQLRLRDPGGHAVVLLEARTFSPTPLARAAESLCGYFMHLSLPQSNFEAARAFWEDAGLIALAAEEAPYPHLPLTSDQLNLAFHRAELCPAALLVFACPDLGAARARLAKQGTIRSGEPRLTTAVASLTAAPAVLITAPEGTSLLLVQAVD
jgi:catechol 2,3-dioxygenase-like lactoylglutathione lyase family enzyme